VKSFTALLAPLYTMASGEEDDDDDFANGCRKTIASGDIANGRSSTLRTSQTDVTTTPTQRRQHSGIRYSDGMLGKEMSQVAALDLRNRGHVPKSWIGKIVLGEEFEYIAGMVVLFNFVVMTIETHATVLEDENVLIVVGFVNRVLLLFYTFECAARMFEMRCAYFGGTWNNLDLSIVLVGWCGQVAKIVLENILGMKGINVEQLTMLKSLRLVRLLRLLRILIIFRELYTLCSGLGRCTKTLMWSAILIGGTLNIWSIMSVEFIHPRILELTEEGTYDKCAWCQTAFSNIWYANLTWFGIITGEGWSDLLRPLVERYYWPFLVVASNVLIVVWGFLNLIVAAIVDSAAAAREEDIKTMAAVAEKDLHDTWLSFHKMCLDMDSDHDGTIEVREFQEQWAQNDDLKSMCAVMGVEEKNIQHLFSILDVNDVGTLQSEQFFQSFYEMRTHCQKTTTYLLFKHIEHLHNIVRENSDVMHELLRRIPPTGKSYTASVFETVDDFSDAGAQPSAQSVAQPAPASARSDGSRDKLSVSARMPVAARSAAKKHAPKNGTTSPGCFISGARPKSVNKLESQVQPEELPPAPPNKTPPSQFLVTPPPALPARLTEAELTPSQGDDYPRFTDNSMDLRSTAFTPQPDLPEGWYYYGRSTPSAASSLSRPNQNGNTLAANVETRPLSDTDGEVLLTSQTFVGANHKFGTAAAWSSSPKQCRNTEDAGFREAKARGQLPRPRQGQQGQPEVNPDGGDLTQYPRQTPATAPEPEPLD